MLTQETLRPALLIKPTIVSKLLDELPLQSNMHVLEISPTDTEHLPYIFQKAENIHYFAAHDPETEPAGIFSDYTADFFDCCYMVNHIYFWSDPLSYFSEIYRVLKPGGTMNLAFIEKRFGGHLPWTQLSFTFYDIDEVKSFFKGSGFLNITVKEMTETTTDQHGKEINRPFIFISGQK